MDLNKAIFIALIVDGFSDLTMEERLRLLFNEDNNIFKEFSERVTKTLGSLQEEFYLLPFKEYKEIWVEACRLLGIDHDNEKAL